MKCPKTNFCISIASLLPTNPRHQQYTFYDSSIKQPKDKKSAVAIFSTASSTHKKLLIFSKIFLKKNLTESLSHSQQQAIKSKHKKFSLVCIYELFCCVFFFVTDLDNESTHNIRFFCLCRHTCLWDAVWGATFLIFPCIGP